jgi:Tol biopolymer transport system component
MTKKIFAISTLILVLVVGAIFVYNFAFKKPETPKTSPEAPKAAEEGKKATSENTTENSQKKSFANPIAAVSDEPVFGPTLSSDENLLLVFSGANGQVNQIDFSGKLEKVVSTEPFQNIKKVLWNKAKNKVIVEIKDASLRNSKFLFLDLAAKTVTTLKDGVDAVSWSNLGDKIIYKYYDQKTKKRTLNISDPNGKNWRKIADTDFAQVKISPVPGSSDISFWPGPSAFLETTLSLVSFSGENKKEILGGKFGADVLWSPDGKRGAVSASDQKGGHKTDLALMNEQGGQFQSLGFPTFVSKCAWSNDSKYLFCALPGNIPESAILPNDWQEGKIATADTFWKIEVSSGKKERLVDAEKISGTFDVLNPFLSRDEKTLFFVNKADGKLYKVQL